MTVDACRVLDKTVAKHKQKECKSKASEVSQVCHVAETKLVLQHNEKGKLQTNLKKFFVHLKDAGSPTMSVPDIFSKCKVENYSPKSAIMENAENSSASSYSLSPACSSCQILPENDSSKSPIANLQGRSPLSTMPKLSLCSVATSSPLTPSSLLTGRPNSNKSNNQEKLSLSQTPKLSATCPSESILLDTPKSFLSRPLSGRYQGSRASERKSCFIDETKSNTGGKSIKVVDLTGNDCVQESSKVACIRKVVQAEGSPNDLTTIPVEKESLDKVAAKLLQFSFDSSKSPRNRRFNGSRFNGDLPKQHEQSEKRNIKVVEIGCHIPDSSSFDNGGRQNTNYEAELLEKRNIIAITDTSTLQCLRPGDPKNENNNNNDNEIEVSIITKPAKQESIITKQEPAQISSKPRRRKDIAVDIDLLLDNSGTATRRSKGKRQNAAMEGEEMSAKKAKMVRIFILFLAQTKHSTYSQQSKH